MLPKIRIGDIKMYYEIHGKGYPLVMIMGLSANKDWWSPYVIEEFSKHFKVLIFDNREREEQMLLRSTMQLKCLQTMH